MEGGERERRGGSKGRRWRGEEKGLAREEVGRFVCDSNLHGGRNF